MRIYILNIIISFIVIISQLVAILSKNDSTLNYVALFSSIIAVCCFTIALTKRRRREDSSEKTGDGSLS